VPPLVAAPVRFRRAAAFFIFHMDPGQVRCPKRGTGSLLQGLYGVFIIRVREEDPDGVAV